MSNGHIVYVRPYLKHPGINNESDVFETNTGGVVDMFKGKLAVNKNGDSKEWKILSGYLSFVDPERSDRSYFKIEKGVQVLEAHLHRQDNSSCWSYYPVCHLKSGETELKTPEDGSFFIKVERGKKIKEIRVQQGRNQIDQVSVYFKQDGEPKVMCIYSAAFKKKMLECCGDEVTFKQFMK